MSIGLLHVLSMVCMFSRTKVVGSRGFKFKLCFQRRTAEVAPKPVVVRPCSGRDQRSIRQRWGRCGTLWPAVEANVLDNSPSLWYPPSYNLKSALSTFIHSLPGTFQYGHWPCTSQVELELPHGSALLEVWLRWSRRALDNGPQVSPSQVEVFTGGVMQDSANHRQRTIWMFFFQPCLSDTCHSVLTQVHGDNGSGRTEQTTCADRFDIIETLFSSSRVSCVS